MGANEARGKELLCGSSCGERRCEPLQPGLWLDGKAGAPIVDVIRAKGGSRDVSECEMQRVAFEA